MWCLANTTVRSPFRLRDGLAALSASPLEGRLRGTEGDIAFRQLLGTHGIVSLGMDATNSVGRKWRSAMEKLGFLYPKPDKASGLEQQAVGPLDCITESGWRLIRAGTLPAMQECFLRALAAFVLPGENGGSFSPLRYLLSVLLELERQTGKGELGFLEMALVVQLSEGAVSVQEAVSAALELRRRRNAAQRKRAFDRQQYKEFAVKIGCVEQTFRDYADTNLRYFKATGLVHGKGRGIALVPEKRRLITRLVEEPSPAPALSLSYYQALCKGAALPTDRQDAAAELLDDLLTELRALGVAVDLTGKALTTPADINLVRYELEELLARQKELRYAARQASEWEEIAAYLEMIAARKERKKLDEDTELMIPRSETPAYLEWAVWRAFLAIGGLCNAPYEARRFPIDQDFMPVATAPGNGPDLMMEFERFALAVEVTLTDNSRQEAAEGEPVRRHVADLMIAHRDTDQKPVYGLFLANHIDSNTAETFRIGVWYTKEDEKMRLTIIPIPLQQFCLLFRALFRSGENAPQQIEALLLDCEKLRADNEAPAWKNKIVKTVEDKASRLPS